MFGKNLQIRVKISSAYGRGIQLSGFTGVKGEEGTEVTMIPIGDKDVLFMVGEKFVTHDGGGLATNGQILKDAIGSGGRLFLSDTFSVAAIFTIQILSGGKVTIKAFNGPLWSLIEGKNGKKSRARVRPLVANRDENRTFETFVIKVMCDDLDALLSQLDAQLGALAERAKRMVMILAKGHTHFTHDKE